MRYPQFRKQGLFVGSGVVEAGCKAVIGSRLKRSGMFWTLRRQRYHRPPLLPPQWKVRGLLGGSLFGSLIFHIYIAHPASHSRGAVNLVDGIGVPNQFFA